MDGGVHEIRVGNSFGEAEGYLICGVPGQDGAALPGAAREVKHDT